MSDSEAACSDQFVIVSETPSLFFFFFYRICYVRLRETEDVFLLELRETERRRDGWSSGWTDRWRFHEPKLGGGGVGAQRKPGSKKMLQPLSVLKTAFSAAHFAAYVTV